MKYFFASIALLSLASYPGCFSYERYEAIVAPTCRENRTWWTGFTGSTYSDCTPWFPKATLLYTVIHFILIPNSLHPIFVFPPLHPFPLSFLSILSLSPHPPHSVPPPLSYLPPTHTPFPSLFLSPCCEVLHSKAITLIYNSILPSSPLPFTYQPFFSHPAPSLPIIPLHPLYTFPPSSSFSHFPLTAKLAYDLTR